MKKVNKMIGVVTFLTVSVASQASTTYDLATDFSDASNPNGVWSYNQGGAPITQTAPTIYLGDRIGWSYLAGLDGSVLQWLTTDYVGLHDLKSGDITIHTLSRSLGGDTTFVGITWTSPSAGLYSISGNAWDAQFGCCRDANWTLSIGGLLVAENNTGVNGLYRTDTAAQFNANLFPGMSLTSMNMTAGEQVTFLTQTTTLYGQYMGVNITVTAVPIPSALWLFLSGLLGVLSFTRKKNR